MPARRSFLTIAAHPNAASAVNSVNSALLRIIAFSAASPGPASIPLSPGRRRARTRRYDREMWRKIATIRARELHLNLSIGRMSDDDLHRAITEAEPNHGWN